MLHQDVVEPTVPSLVAAKRPLTQSQVLSTVLKNWRLQLCSCSSAVAVEAALAAQRCQEMAGVAV
eukprot:5333982-Lingulodinium_polyedra.AAC.1